MLYLKKTSVQTLVKSSAIGPHRVDANIFLQHSACVKNSQIYPFSGVFF